MNAPGMRNDMTDLPAPLVAPDCDCSDLDSFMLNVERLMASELVALSSHEVIAASLFLWCRAWKQSPAASLPDDDRVNAAFAKLPLARFRKLKTEVMRGFVKCSDGRLYHRFLAQEATSAYAKKKAFRMKRDADAERLRKWRVSQRETPDETPGETPVETRFVAEGQGQGQYRDRDKERKKGSEANASAPVGAPASVPIDARTELFREGLAELVGLTGKPDGKCRQLLGKWLKETDDDAKRVRLAIGRAVTDRVADAVSWIEAALKPKPQDWRDRPELRGVM